MNKRVLGLAMLGLIVGWWCFWSPPAASQPAEGTKVGRYVYVSGGLFTVVMVDTQTGKTYALSSPKIFDGPRGDQPPEYAWVPIEKFEDLDAYRRWIRDRRESWMRFTTSSDDAIMKEQISLIHEMSAILEKVTDAASFKEAGAKVKALEKKAKDLEAKTKDWSEDKKKAMLEKHKTAIQAALERFVKAQTNAVLKGGGVKLPGLP